MIDILPDNEILFEELLHAYLDCRNSKRYKNTQLDFELDHLNNLRQLLVELNTYTYQIQQSIVFIITDPKIREVWAATFRDRIVHHLIYNNLKYIEKRFIEDTYSCIENRGTLAAAYRLDHFCKSITHTYTKTAYYFKFDITNFFGSIDKNILWNIVEPLISRTIIKKLLYQVIFNDPTIDPIYMGNYHNEVLQLPQHKSLFNRPKDVGLPIGNITSQFLSNLYLNILDQYIKHQLHCKYYLRYADDAIILDYSKDNLLYYQKIINEYLYDQLHLTLHPDKCYINEISSGIDFVGYIIYPYYTQLRPHTIEKVFKITKNKKYLPLEDLTASINSYLGMLRHTTSYNTRKLVCQSCHIPMIIEYNDTYTKVSSFS
jgi:hypothetical protein